MNPLLVELKLIRFSPRYFITCIAFSCVELGLSPIPIGLASQAFFNAVATDPAGPNVWSAIALLVAAQLVQVVGNSGFGNPWNSLQQKSRVLLQRNLMAAILRGYGRFGLRTSLGEAISRFRDDPDPMADGLDAICDLIGRTLFAAIAVIVMWRINAMLTLVLCGPLLLTAWLTEVLGTRTMVYRAASRMATSQVTGFLGELLGAHLAVTVAGAHGHAVARLNVMGETRRRMAVRDTVFDVLLDSFSINLGHVGTGVVLLLGAHLVADGSFSVGDFALFVVYLDRLVWYPTEIARLISDLKRIEVTYARMLALVPGEPAGALVTRPAAASRAPLSEPRSRLRSLEVRGLSYTYPGGTQGITDVSFALDRGSFTVITGRIGSGKSTLLHALLGLLPRDGGEILWNGRAIRDPASFLVPPRSAFTPQVPHLFSDSLRDNLLLGRNAEPEAIERAVHAAALEQDVRNLERGLDTRVGPRGVKLSGGQIQRAAAARMFLSDADLLVMDDLSSGLDAETEAELWSRLFARRREVTCLVVSHRPAALHRADQVLVLEAGRILSAATLNKDLPLLPAARSGEPDGRVDIGLRLEG